MEAQGAPERAGASARADREAASLDSPICSSCPAGVAACATVAAAQQAQRTCHHAVRPLTRCEQLDPAPARQPLRDDCCHLHARVAATHYHHLWVQHIGLQQLQPLQHLAWGGVGWGGRGWGAPACSPPLAAATEKGGSSTQVLLSLHRQVMRNCCTQPASRPPRCCTRRAPASRRRRSQRAAPAPSPLALQRCWSPTPGPAPASHRAR